ncbi:MAG: MFS transporter [Geminicoccaceae bacterium]|nr:MFS transporter [Geminicoccaceae bacterium]MCB2009302.1 MFS transporter [Geminicoccaceae bacterium]
MLATIRANWALLVGIGLLMLGHGLQGTLLGVRAVIEQFPTSVTGIIMSGYSIGFLASAVFTQRLVRKVGHVRVFAALSAVASAAILAHSILAEPFTWFVLRFVTGFCMSGVYVIAESWLNASTDNEHRGQLLSVYMVVQLSAWAGGQLLLNLGDPGDFPLFIFVSVLVSIAVVPLLLSAIPAPVLPAARKFSLADLYKTSPLGCIGMMAVGLSQGGFFNMGAVFAQTIGFSVAEISMMMAVTTIGGMLLQWPVGQLSDKLDRRTVLTVVTLVASVALTGTLVFGFDDPYSLTAAFFIYGGMCLPMYSLCVAHTNDYLESDQMIGASSTLVFANGLGMVVGPLVLGPVMQWSTPFAFIAMLAIVHGVLGIFAIYRSRVRPSVPLDEQGQHVYIPAAAPTSVVTSIAQEEAVENAES